MTNEPDVKQEALLGIGKVSLVFLMLGLAGIGMGQSILFAILPPAGREIGLSETQVATIAMAAALVFVIASPIWGRLADRFSRKPVIVMGLLGYGLTTGLFAWIMEKGIGHLIAPMSVFYILVAVRILYALVSSGVVPASQALMADGTVGDKRMKAMAAIQAAFGIGMVVGPGIVPLFVVFGLAAPLYIAGGFSIIAAFVVWVGLKEAPPGPKVVGAVGERVSFFDRRIRPYLVLAMVFFICVAGVQQLAAFVYQDVLGLDAQRTAATVGVDLVIGFVGMIVTQIAVMRSKGVGVGALLLLGLLFSILSMTLFLLADVRPMLIGALIFFGMSIGCFSPALMTGATLAVDKSAVGAVSGYVASLQSAGYIFGPVLATLLYRLESHIPFVCLMGLYGVLMVFVLFQARGGVFPLGKPSPVTGEKFRPKGSGGR